MSRPPRADRHSTTMTLAEYQAELRERTGFLVSLGGTIIAICLYNVAVRQQIEIETYGHPTKLLNQEFVVQGILDFKQYIDAFLIFIPIFLALLTFFNKNSPSVKVKETKILTNIVYPIAIFAIISTTIIGACATSSIWEERESSVGAISMVWVFVITNVVSLISLFKRKKDIDEKYLTYDVKVLTPVAISFILLVGVSIPYMYSLNSIISDREIDFVQNANKSYYLVEKDKDKFLLREIEEKKQEKEKPNGDVIVQKFFVPTSNYKTVNATDVTITKREMLSRVGNELRIIDFGDVETKKKNNEK